MTGKAGLNRYHKGVVMDVLAVGICIIAMTIMMMVCLGSSALLNRKAQISQTARKYILKMIIRIVILSIILMIIFPYTAK
jgi:hypothetical protein